VQLGRGDASAEVSEDAAVAGRRDFRGHAA
jgi:hypothetical protein